jgi:hypothetical protein
MMTKIGCRQALSVALFASLVGASSAYAQNDLVNCLWKDGRAMAQRDCATLRRIKADDDEQRRRSEEQQQAGRQREAERQAQAKEAERQQALVAEQRRAEERDRQEAQQRETDAWLAKDAAEQERRSAIANQRAQALRAKCGADYKVPRVGMTYERAAECVGPLRMYSQLQRADGLISVYTGPGVMLHVMGQKVVAWTRL